MFQAMFARMEVSRSLDNKLQTITFSFSKQITAVSLYFNKSNSDTSDLSCSPLNKHEF